MTFSMSPTSPSTKINMEDEVIIIWHFSTFYSFLLFQGGGRESSSQVFERSGGGKSCRQEEAAKICKYSST